MRSDTLQVSVIVILMFLAPEYLIALILWVCGAPFLSSMSLMLDLDSRPLGLSSGAIGGLTHMIKHLGSAVGSGCVPWFGGLVGCLGLWACVALLVRGLAAIDAHDDWLVPFIGVVGSQLFTGGPVFDSSSLILLVRYALVLAMYAMVDSVWVLMEGVVLRADIFSAHASKFSASRLFTFFTSSSLYSMYPIVSISWPVLLLKD